MSVTSSAPPPPLTFQTFLEKMRQPSAGSLVREVKRFIAELDARGRDASANERVEDLPRDASSLGREVRAFLKKTEAAFERHPAWANASAAELEASGEGLEKYVMTKAHGRVFGRGRRDEERDVALRRRIAALRELIEAKNLDVAESSHARASWALAESELGKMNQFKAPRDKLVCVLNTCRIINNTLTSRQGGDGGADEFLPVLVYVTLRANPENLESNLKYIQRFRGESRLVSEAAYFFTNLVSAVAFLSRAQASDFTDVNESAFNAALSEAGVLEPIDMDDDDEEEEADEADDASTSPPPPATNGSSTMGTPIPTTPTTPISLEEMTSALSALSEQRRDERSPLEFDASAPAPATPESVAQSKSTVLPVELHTPIIDDELESFTAGVSSRGVADATKSTAPAYIPWRTTEDVEAEGATALTALDVAGELALSDYKFLYAKVDDLTVGDVSRLLNDYKGLALQYESLSRGVAKVLASLHRAP